MNRTNPSPSLPTVQRAVVQNQMLWTAGYSLTSGSFLTYFAKELGASWTLISLILVIPEDNRRVGDLEFSSSTDYGKSKEVRGGRPVSSQE